MSELTKRQVLVGTGATMAALAGCTGRRSGDARASEGVYVTASFFVLGDFTRAVLGDVGDVDTLVPFGQHGHGWEPSTGIQRDVLDSDAFVYMGEGFQPWADRAVRNARGDGADVGVVEARHGVDLLPAPDGHGAHDDHQEESHEGEGAEEEQHDDHDHGDHDPHFWLDPTRAAAAVSTIERELVDTFPDHAETFAANAASYRRTLTDLDETFADRLAERERDTVLVAGHNAFQYFAERYGFEVHGLTGIAPDDSPTPKDVKRAQEVVEREGVTHVLAPVFESDRAARQLVEETDAEGVLPITAIPGVTEEWHAEGWGYVEVMREVNLASLATGLGA